MEIKEFTKKLKQKRELNDMDDSFIENRIKDYIKKNKLEKKFKIPGFSKTSAYKKMFKALRKDLREIYGVFRSKTFMENPSIKERLVYYKEIYHKIFSITGKPKKILDLGCGLNPLSYKYMDHKPYYYACDISENDLKKVREYFRRNKVKGKVFTFDLVYGDYNDLPKANVCFLFKTLEALEQIKNNISKDIIKNLDCDWIVASFSKKSLSGKRIKKAGRAWLRRLLKKLDLHYKIFDIGNEIFFVIKKE